MKGIFSVFALSFLSGMCLAQENKSIPQNFTGFFAGVEWNTVSGLIGASYERTVLIKDKLTIGIKGLYVFSYGYGNAAILWDDNDGRASLGAIIPTLHYSTSKAKTGNDGFFVQFGLGTALRRTTDGEVKYTNAVLCMEPEFGWQCRIAKKLTLTWTNSILFAGHGGITMTGLSVGF
jgi:hypothetical protein